MKQEAIREIKSGNAVVVGRRIYVLCRKCGKYVQRNKFILGDLHFCITEVK